MKHYLHVVEEEDLDGKFFDRWIEHSEECPKENIYGPDLLGRPIYDFVCEVGSWSSFMGLEDLVNDERFDTPGKHEIAFHHYWSGSIYDDSEAYLYFVESDNEI